jgi:Beta propeller domain
MMTWNIWHYNDTMSKDSTVFVAVLASKYDPICYTSHIQPISMGMIPGTLLTSYSIDIVNKMTLRVATTVMTYSRSIIPIVRTPSSSNTTNSDSPSSSSSSVSTSPSPFVSDQPTTYTPTRGPSVAPVVRPINLLPTVSPSSQPTVGYNVVEKMTVEKYIIIMNITQRDNDDENDAVIGSMIELSRIQLGLPEEVFTSVRFYDNLAYAITFEQTDPFYVLNLTNVTHPNVVGELKNITGFSNYLHSLNANNTLLLGIGQEADRNGNILGSQISMYDMSNLQNPIVLHRHVMEIDKYTYSSTDSTWDFKATRYTDGRLFIPMDMYTYYPDGSSGTFRGFVSFSIDLVDGIEELCYISTYKDMYYPMVVPPGWNEDGTMAPTSEVPRKNCTYCQGNLPRRSMIFDGNWMTTDGSSIFMTNLSTCQPMWNVTISIPDPSSYCCQ